MDDTAKYADQQVWTKTSLVDTVGTLHFNPSQVVEEVHMRLMLVTSLVLICATSARAEEQVPAACHKLATDYIRLMCYDTATGYVKRSPSPRPAAPTGQVATTPKPSEPLTSQGKQWRLETEKSALDDREDVWLSVISDNREGNAIGSPEPAVLWLRCMENSTNVLISFNRYTSDDQNVQYKFDDGSIQKQWMETVRGGEGIGIWSGSRAIPFIKEAVGKQKLIISYDTYDGPVEFTFDVSGLGERITPLVKACGWEL